MRNKLLLFFSLASLAVLAACAPTAAPGGSGVPSAALDSACVNEPPPVVAVVNFTNTTRTGDITVLGVEDAATARLITMLKESGCYVVVERSELQTIIEQQGMESLDPVALAKAAGAGYVVTGTVTRATIAKPGASLFGFTVGATTAQVEMDVRATDIISGTVVVSMRGSGDASNPNIATSRIPGGTIAYSDPTVGPLLAEAADEAVTAVVAALRARF